MNFKQHLCGVAVAYDEFVKGEPKSVPSDSRPNGSLYNRQKREIADATEYLRRHLRNSREHKPLIFVLTSPGYTSIANTPKFISLFVENMRANYGMGEYVWVREHTKQGYPHFHFIAEWHKTAWFFEDVVYRGKTMKRINAISLYWSDLFGADSINSIRLGSFHPVTKKRTFYVSQSKQCWYLCKYIGKSIGDNGHEGYLVEAGFSATRYKKAVRSFQISKMLREWSSPIMFKDYYVYKDTGEVCRFGMGAVEDHHRPVERIWISDNKGQLIEHRDDVLSRFQWRWTGHGNTYIGFEMREGRAS